MKSKEKLLFAVRSLAEAREELAAAATRELDALEELEKLETYQLYQTRNKFRKDLDKIVTAKEEDTRTLAVATYNETKEKTFPGVQVIDGYNLVYTDEDAIKHCVENRLTSFLALDTKKLERWLKANLADENIAEQLGLSWAKIVKVKGARIAGDLSAALFEISVAADEPEVKE